MLLIKHLQARCRGISLRSKLRNEFKINKNLFVNNGNSYKQASFYRIVTYFLIIFLFSLKIKKSIFYILYFFMTKILELNSN